MKNCWTFAVLRFEQCDGLLIVRFTRRSSARPSRLFGWLGVVLVAVGVAAINWGAMLRTGRWLHVYHAPRISGPYDSYEPDHGPAIKRPPWSFKGRVIRARPPVNRNPRRVGGDTSGPGDCSLTDGPGRHSLIKSCGI